MLTVLSGQMSTLGRLLLGDPVSISWLLRLTYLAPVVYSYPLLSMPDWLNYSSDYPSGLSGLVEALDLNASPFLLPILAPMGMDPSQHAAVWRVSLDYKPQTVALSIYDTMVPLIEASSLYQVHQAVGPSWYWEDGVLWIGKLANSAESALPLGSSFTLGDSISPDLRFPVYLCWRRLGGEVAYLVDRESLRGENGSVQSIYPKFGTFLGYQDDLALGVSEHVLEVPGKAHPWLVFQSSSGGDSLPACAPSILPLDKDGFVEVHIVKDNVVLDKVRGLEISRSGEGGLSGCSGMRGQLVGVFVGDNPPTFVQISHVPFYPGLGQVFPIQDGGRYKIPEGAAKLVLGVLHDGAYRNGEGSYSVRIFEYERDGLLYVSYVDPLRLSQQQVLLVDGKEVVASAWSADSNRYSQWVRWLGNPLHMHGWTGWDMIPFLQTVAAKYPVLPLGSRVHEWDGVSDLQLQYPTVEVLDIPQRVVWEGQVGSNQLPYWSDRYVVLNRLYSNLIQAGDFVKASIPLWSLRSSGLGYTLESTINLAGKGSSTYLVVERAYSIYQSSPSARRASIDQSTHFAWADELN